MTSYRGFKISMRNKRDYITGREVEVKIDQHYQWTYNALSSEGANREKILITVKRWIDASLERPDAYTWTSELTPAQLKRRTAMASDFVSQF